ncbi:MAG TPA: helix-turn-helix transcriptional regulator [Thermoanaerobaculia bacterium]|jgi:transcriptional regulator with XRE-family HTH domain
MLSSVQLPPQRPSDFGGLVRQLRDARGWTQEKLAREADITVTSVSNLERGATKPSTETVEKIAAAFGLRASELDPRRLAALVAQQAISFTRRRAITRLLEIGEREVEAVIAFLEERAKRKPK